ncbi:hypothetical protein AB1N83_013546 [Pleurotus pulmonarius]
MSNTSLMQTSSFRISDENSHTEGCRDSPLRSCSRSYSETCRDIRWTTSDSCPSFSPVQRASGPCWHGITILSPSSDVWVGRRAFGNRAHWLRSVL